jgi:tetratricopeptide (TPR) repeat protein
MTSEYVGDLIRQAEIYLKSGELEIARKYLERVLDLGGDLGTRVLANYYMSQATTDPEEKRKYLEETLAIDPIHPGARRALAVLDGKLKPEDIVDADHLPAQASTPEPVQADRFTCPRCGSRMVYAPDGRSLVCEACARREALPGQAPKQEQDFFLAMATGKSQRAPTATQAFQCQGCGAQFLLPPAALSETCSYCGSVHVVQVTKDLITPDAILPMAFDQQEASVRLGQWMTKHGIQAQGELPAPHGLYLPLWSFDLMGEIPWNGKVYHNKQVVPLSGQQTVAFNGILIPATSQLADLLPKILKDLDLRSMQAYDPRYLAGWAAEVYTRDMADASLDARESALERIRETIQASAAGLEDLSFSTANLFVDAFQLILVPLWLAGYVHDGKKLRVAINGQNGAVHGQTSTRGILGWLEGIAAGE